MGSYQGLPELTKSLFHDILAFCHHTGGSIVIDEYIHSHPEVALNTDRISLRDQAIVVHAYRIARDPTIQPIALDIFGLTRSARVQSLYVQLSVEMILARSVRENLNVAERLLLEVVVLHRLKEYCEDLQISFPRAGRAVVIMGTMIQHRLTQLLLNIRGKERARVYGLGKIGGLCQEHWEMEFIGAAAVARVVMGFHAIEDTVIRFPTVEEDADHGIDLLVEFPPIFPGGGHGQNLQLAVSVKSVNREERIQAVHVTPTVLDTANGSVCQLQRIVQGAQTLNERYAHVFIPVQILAGRPTDSNYTLYLMQEETRELERLLRTVENSFPSRRALRRVV